MGEGGPVCHTRRGFFSLSLFDAEPVSFVVVRNSRLESFSYPLSVDPVPFNPRVGLLAPDHPFFNVRPRLNSYLMFLLWGDIVM